MNAIVPQSFGAVSSVFAGASKESLGAGIQGGYGHIGYKGKVWSIRHRGNEQAIMRADGDGPANSIEVVILKAPENLSKIWYENGYEEGSRAAPDCFSSNGVTPDAASTKRQSATCALCPKNAWGSAVSKVTGKATKACNDSKRLAVVPLNDLRNEVFGGPMLLRVPAASLQEMAQYGSKMENLGYPYYAVGTRIAFDVNSAFPKFTFAAIRPLSDAEARAVVELRASAEVARILAEASDATAQPVQTQQQAIAAAFEQPPANPPQPAASVAFPSTQAAPQPTPIATPAPAASPSKPAPVAAFGGAVAAPVTSAGDAAPTGIANFDKELDALLAK